MTNLQNNSSSLESLISLANSLPSQIAVDATLTTSGAAADAKITGDKIEALEGRIIYAASLPSVASYASGTICLVPKG